MPTETTELLGSIRRWLLAIAFLLGVGVATLAEIAFVSPGHEGEVVFVTAGVFGVLVALGAGIQLLQTGIFY